MVSLSSHVKVAEIEDILDLANEKHLELEVVAALIRQGWVTEDGVLAHDLLPLLQAATQKAFNDVL